MTLLKSLTGIFGAILLVIGIMGITNNLDQLDGNPYKSTTELQISLYMVLFGLILLIASFVINDYSNYVPKLQRWPDYIAPWAIGINNRFPEQNIYKELESVPQ